jgi:hypothetical protein
MSDVAAQQFQTREAPLVAHTLFCLIDAAQRLKGAPARLLRRHAARQVLLGRHLQVEPEFLVEIGVKTMSREDGLEPADERAEPSHGLPPIR